MRFTTASRMANIDRRAIEEHGIAETALMETAGQLTARHVRRYFLSDRSRARVNVICGKGHNGADGLVAGRWLDNWGYRVRIVLIAPLDECSELTQTQARALNQNPRVDCGPYDPEEPLPEADCTVDALLGTGLSGNPRSPYDEVIRRLNNTSHPVVALDIPSGLSGDRHVPFDPCVNADLTVTFGLPKLGMLLEPGYTQVGELIVQELGFPRDAYQSEAGEFHLITADDVRGFLPARAPTGHKGSSGRLGVFAGSEAYPGAPYLAGEAASRTGAGLVSLIGPDGLSAHQSGGSRDLVFPFSLSDLDGGDWGEELRDFIQQQDAFVIGPGMGTGSRPSDRLESLLPRLKAPAVVDADGLNNFSDRPEVFRTLEQGVLTPHPGEAARLLSCEVPELLHEPIERTRELVETVGHPVVLKTSRPILVHPEGSVSVNVTGSPALSKAGSGDVLTGFIGGFMAQGLPPAPAACLALYLHGACGRDASRDQDVLTVRAEDLIRVLPSAINALESDDRPDWFPVRFESCPPDVLQWSPFQS